MNKTLAFLFTEPSTRTYASFYLAARRLGCEVVTFDRKTSSMAKGESLEDTIETLCLIGYDGIVLRTEYDNGYERALSVSTVPVIDAGSGTYSHPSQAAIDEYTLRRRGVEPASFKAAFVGDVMNSRVYRSVKDIFGSHLVTNAEGAATSGAKVIYCLRPQFERGFDGSYEGYHVEKHHLDRNDAFLMHAGPVIGVEFDDALMADERCLVREQVANSVLVRKAILRNAFYGYDNRYVYR